MKQTAKIPKPITTDLLTPLGAYLRLRGKGSASFLLESVEHGRLGRYSLVGYSLLKAAELLYSFAAILLRVSPAATV